jgi:membrane protein required for colicin V production
MTWLDWALIAVLLFSFVQGVRRGPLVGLLSTVGLLAGFVAAAVWYSSLAEVVRLSLHVEKAWAGTVAFLALLLAISLVVSIVVTQLLSGAKLSGPARLIGGLFGVIRGAVFAILLLVVGLASPVGAMIRTDTDHSRLAPSAVRGYKMAVKAVAPYLPSTIRLPDADQTRF